MKSRYWVTLTLRLVGVVLIGITIRPLAANVVQVLELSIRARVPFWDNVYPWQWVEVVVLFALGLYLFLDGSWVVNRVFRGLEPNRCPKCGYDTHGLKPGAVCPECGTSPDDSQ